MKAGLGPSNLNVFLRQVQVRLVVMKYLPSVRSLQTTVGNYSEIIMNIDNAAER